MGNNAVNEVQLARENKGLEKVFNGLVGFEHEWRTGAYYLNGRVFDKEGLDNLNQTPVPIRILAMQPMAVTGVTWDDLINLQKTPYLTEIIDRAKALKELLAPDTMDYAYEKIEHYARCQKKGSTCTKLTLPQRTIDCYKELRNFMTNKQDAYFLDSREFTNTIFLMARDACNEERLSKLGSLQKKLEESVRVVLRDPRVKRMRKIFAQHFDELDEGPEKIIVARLLSNDLFLMEEVESEWARLKLARFDGLGGINNPIAKSYLCFNPLVSRLFYHLERSDYHGFIGKLREKTFQEHEFSKFNNTSHMLMDNMLYDSWSLLVNFIEDEVNRLGQQFVAQQKDVPVSIQNITKIGPDNRAMMVQEIMHGRNRGDFSDDMQRRITYFAEDVFDRFGMPLKYAKELSDVFFEFRLDRKMKDRNKRPNDMKVRRFFDDVTLRYVVNGKVPTSEELERTYESA